MPDTTAAIAYAQTLFDARPDHLARQAVTAVHGESPLTMIVELQNGEMVAMHGRWGQSLYARLSFCREIRWGYVPAGATRLRHVWGERAVVDDAGFRHPCTCAWRHRLWCLLRGR